MQNRHFLLFEIKYKDFTKVSFFFKQVPSFTILVSKRYALIGDVKKKKKEPKTIHTIIQTYKTEIAPLFYKNTSIQHISNGTKKYAE